jgi:hypothetical protein
VHDRLEDLHHAAELLGVHRAGELGRRCDVRDEHGYLFALRLRGARPRSRFGRRCRGAAGRLRFQRRVLSEHRRLQPSELGSRLQAELIDQGLANGAIGSERIGLATCAIEREDELPGKPLAGGMSRGKGLELGHERGVTPQGQFRVHAILDRGEAELLESLGLRLGPDLVHDLGVGASPPQCNPIAMK